MTGSRRRETPHDDDHLDAHLLPRGTARPCPRGHRRRHVGDELPLVASRQHGRAALRDRFSSRGSRAPRARRPSARHRPHLPGRHRDRRFRDAFRRPPSTRTTPLRLSRPPCPRPSPQRTPTASASPPSPTHSNSASRLSPLPLRFLFFPSSLHFPILNPSFPLPPSPFPPFPIHPQPSLTPSPK